MVAAAGLRQRFTSRRAAGRAPGNAAGGLVSGDGPFPPLVPLFVLGFLAMVILRSTGWLSPGWLDVGNALQELLLGMALFGLGSAVRIRTLLHTGSRALLAALASWFLIAVLGLGAALLMILS
jgi:uncharacterized membrane protein YadS